MISCDGDDDDDDDKVKQLNDESGTEISDHFLDRAHRVGKPFTIEDQNGIKTQKQQVIVKFTTWYHRTLLYRKRKNSKNIYRPYTSKIHIIETLSRTCKGQQHH